MNFNFRAEAIKALVPEASFRTRNDQIFWDSPDLEQPTEAEIEAEIVRLNTEYDAQEYARNRLRAYPDWQTQLEKIADDGVDKWKSEMLEPVKAKYPKPE